MWGNKNLSLENFTNRKWLMTKTSKAQTNKYHRFLEDMKTENINLSEAFIARILIEKLPNSWNDYKQQLKHKHR